MAYCHVVTSGTIPRYLSQTDVTVDLHGKTNYEQYVSTPFMEQEAKIQALILQAETERAKAETERARAETESAKAETERARAENESTKAETERARADNLQKQLEELQTVQRKRLESE